MPSELIEFEIPTVQFEIPTVLHSRRQEFDMAANNEIALIGTGIVRGMKEGIV